MKAIITYGTGKKAKYFTFHLLGKNNKCIARASEHYTRKQNLLKTLKNYFEEYEIIDETSR